MYSKLFTLYIFTLFSVYYFLVYSGRQYLRERFRVRPHAYKKLAINGAIYVFTAFYLFVILKEIGFIIKQVHCYSNI